MVDHTDKDTFRLERRRVLYAIGGMFLLSLNLPIKGLNEKIMLPDGMDQDIVIVGNWVMLKQDLL